LKSLCGCFLAGLALFIALPQPSYAQLSADQRVFDFQSLAALYAKRYAPADWKFQALGFDMFDLKPWLDRVKAAKDDLEFFEIEAGYVARLQDTHTGFQMTSSFAARLGAIPFPGGGTLLGMTVDIYDGKVLIDGISRTALPASSYPFQIGDELVSVDGVAVEDWITRLSTWRQYGNPATTRRFASQQIINRTQTVFPRAVETPDSSTIQVRRTSGALESYTIPWYKTGFPLTTVGPVPSPRNLEMDSVAPPPDYLQALEDLHNYRLPDNDPLFRYYVGLGAPIPQFRAGFPSNFVQRLGSHSTDFHYSGTYTLGGLTLGYLRIPNFSPANTATAVSELKTEIDYMQKNTDGLIVDVTRNPGGGCYMIDVASSLIPYPFYFFGEQIRVTEDRLNSFESLLESAKSSGAAQSVIDTYQLYLNATKSAFAANRGLTVPVPACKPSTSNVAPISFNNPPGSTVYAKPMIVLIDELSISAADIFPSMIQDNHRALLVGARSSGGGGSVSGWYTGFYSESYSTNTNTLVVRKNPITTPEYPPAPYVENIGARPDVPIEFMTTENLLNGGRTYVNQFTQVLVDQIQAEASAATFSISDRGGVIWTTPDASGQPVVGFGRIQASNGTSTPSGLAIFGFRQNGVLVTEATVPAIKPISSGRIYAESSGLVRTGIAIANPNFTPATVSFYITGSIGNFNGGTFVIPANGQVAAFLDQAPFNGPQQLSGTFTFSSAFKVAAVGLRGFTNERGEFLLTTLPVADLSAAPAAGSTQVIPHFADGGGWRTEIALVNPGDSTMTGTIVFKGKSGTALTMMVDGRTATSFSYSIPPRASQKLTTSGSGQIVQSGSIVIAPATGAAPPVGSAVFSFQQGGITVTQAGVPAMGSVSAYRLYAEATDSFDISTVGAIQTGLAIVNQASTAAEVKIELFHLDGSSTGSIGTITVPASGQVSQFLNQIPGLGSLALPFQGVARVSSSSAISVIGLRGRYNERRELLFNTTMPVDETAAATDADLIFPHFAAAGGYTTQFVLFSGSAGQQSTGSLRFVSQSGEVLNLTLQ